MGPLLAGLKNLGDHRVLVLCDHFTPLALRTHSSEPVPYVLYDSRTPGDQLQFYTENDARETGTQARTSVIERAPAMPLAYTAILKPAGS